MTIRPATLPRSRSAPAAAAWLRVLGAYGRDMGAVVGVVLVYFVLRGLAGWDEAYAVRVTLELVRIERALGIFHEAWVQQLSIRSHAVQEVANFVYAYLHFPVLIAVGTWLWFLDRQRFRFMRNVMYVSMVFGLLFYYLLPAAPPRLMALHGYDLGFVDTVFGGNTAVSYAQPSIILNEYAAIPSFHFGWIAMASAVIWGNTRSAWLRAFGIFLSVLMTWAIVASANHFFVDMILGGVIVAISWFIARRIERRTRRVPAPALRG
jgi:hypothetical protein